MRRTNGEELDAEADEGFLSGVVIEVAANRCKVLVNNETLECSYRRVMLKHDSAFTTWLQWGMMCWSARSSRGWGWWSRCCRAGICWRVCTDRMWQDQLTAQGDRRQH